LISRHSLRVLYLGFQCLSSVLVRMASSLLRSPKSVSGQSSRYFLSAPVCLKSSHSPLLLKLSSKKRRTILYISFDLLGVDSGAHLVSDDVQMVAEISQPVPQIVQAGNKPVTSFCRSSCYVSMNHRDSLYNRVTPPRTRAISGYLRLSTLYQKT
jgi:hypothetical protein